MESEQVIARFGDANESTHPQGTARTQMMSASPFHLGSAIAWNEHLGRVPCELHRTASARSAAANHAGHNKHGAAELRLVEDLHSIGHELEERIGAQPRRLDSFGGAPSPKPSGESGEPRSVRSLGRRRLYAPGLPAG